MISIQCVLHQISLQQAFACQLNLSRGLAVSETTSRRAEAFSLANLEFILMLIPDAGAVVWKMDARERIGTQVLVADG